MGVEYVEIYCMKLSDLILKDKVKEIKDSAEFLMYLSQHYIDMSSNCRNSSHNKVEVNQSQRS